MKKEKREYRSSSKMVSNMTTEEFCATVEKEMCIRDRTKSDDCGQRTLAPQACGNGIFPETNRIYIVRNKRCAWNNGCTFG